MTRTELRSLADSAAARHGVSPSLVRAIVSVESSWNPRATRFEASYLKRVHGPYPVREMASSWGLGQLMWPTAVQLYGKPFNPRWLIDPSFNLDLTARHLGRLWARYGNVRDVAAAYNSGRPWSSAPDYTRRRYVPKVLALLGMRQAEEHVRLPSMELLQRAPWLRWAALVAGGLLVGAVVVGGRR